MNSAKAVLAHPLTLALPNIIPIPQLLSIVIDLVLGITGG